MACEINGGVSRDCRYIVAGLKYLWLFNQDIANTITTDADGIVTAITLGGSGKAYKYEFTTDSANFQDQLTTGANNHKYRTHTVTAIFDNDEELYEQIDNLSLGKIVAVVEDNNNMLYMLGFYNGLNATVMDYDSGSAAGDSVGYTLTLVGTEMSPALKVESEAVIEALLA